MPKKAKEKNAREASEVDLQTICGELVALLGKTAPQSLLLSPRATSRLMLDNFVHDCGEAQISTFMGVAQERLKCAGNAS